MFLTVMQQPTKANSSFNAKSLYLAIKVDSYSKYLS